VSDATWPRLKLGSHLVPGLAAAGLFVVLAVVVVGSDFGAAEGFPTDASITASIGYAMFNLGQGGVDSEGFLIAFEIIDVVLVAALAAAVMLARTESGGSVVTALTDGGRTVADTVRGRDAPDTTRGRDADDGVDGRDATDTVHSREEEREFESSERGESADTAGGDS
jgi:NADH-quinone oxidoreductase subunit J